MYPFYEKIAKTGIRNVCIHKGLFAPAIEEKFPRLRPYANVNDICRAAKDWPQLNFLVYHSGYRWVGGNPADGGELRGQQRSARLIGKPALFPPVLPQRPVQHKCKPHAGLTELHGHVSIRHGDIGIRQPDFAARIDPGKPSISIVLCNLE